MIAAQQQQRNSATAAERLPEFTNTIQERPTSVSIIMSWKGSSGGGSSGGGGGGSFRHHRPHVEEGEIGEEEGEIVPSQSTGSPPRKRFPPPSSQPFPDRRSSGGRGGAPPPPGFSARPGSFRALAGDVPTAPPEQQQPPPSSATDSSRRLPDHVFSSSAGSSSAGRRSFSSSGGGAIHREGRDFGGGRSGRGGGHRGRGVRPSPPRGGGGIGPRSNSFGPRGTSYGGRSDTRGGFKGGGRGFNRDGLPQRSASASYLSGAGTPTNQQRSAEDGVPHPANASRSSSFGTRPEVVERGSLGRNSSLGSRTLEPSRSTDSTDRDMLSVYGRGEAGSSDGQREEAKNTPPSATSTQPRQRRFTSYTSLAEPIVNRDYYGPAIGEKESTPSSGDRSGPPPPRRSTWHPQRSPSESMRRTKSSSFAQSPAPPPPLHGADWSLQQQQQQQKQQQRPSTYASMDRDASYSSVVPESSYSGSSDRETSYSSLGRDASFSSNKDRHTSYSSADRDAPYTSVDRDVPYSSVDRDVPYSSVDRDTPYSSADRDTSYSNNRDTSYSSADRDMSYSSLGRDLPFSRMDVEKKSRPDSNELRPPYGKVDAASASESKGKNEFAVYGSSTHRDPPEQAESANDPREKERYHSYSASPPAEQPAPYRHPSPPPVDPREKSHDDRTSPPKPPITSSQLLAGTAPARDTTIPTGEEHQQQEVEAVSKPVPQAASPPRISPKHSTVAKISVAPSSSVTQAEPLPVQKNVASEPQPAIAVVQEPPKATSPAPLTCANLGSPETVAKAEAAVKQLSGLLSNPDLIKSSNGDAATLLPPKHLIIKALAGLDVKLKRGEADTAKAQSDIKEALKEEAHAKRAREEKQAKQEEALIKEQHQLKARKEAEGKLKQALLKTEETKRQQREESRMRARAQLEVRITELKESERKKRKRAMSQQIQHVVSGLESEITTVQEELDKATRAATKAGKKAAKLGKEYREATNKGVPELAPEVGSRNDPQPMADLVSSIIAENKRRAAAAQQEVFDFCLPNATPQHNADGTNEEDGKRSKTNEEWTVLARNVTGPENALYTEPSESPFYKNNSKTHEVIRPLVTEYVRDRKRRIQERGEELAEEYVVRKQLYTKKVERSGSAKHHHGSSKAVDNSRRGSTSIMGAKPASRGESGNRGGRGSSNPYRRARRGNPTGDIVRSEYEQDQIIEQITAQEAMEKRIAHGGSKLPNQVTQVEKELTPRYINTFSSQLVLDPLAESEEDQYFVNEWSDMEKCIFLDRFLQHPKDFRKIASFLRNKSTRDCIKFYYNSKQSVPYKAALKEHMTRRKRRGEYNVWDATIQAALSCGAIITEGTSEERPLQFSLPSDDHTYFTYKLHPMRREIFDDMVIEEGEYNDEPVAEETDTKTRKRNHGTLCMLDESQGKYLKRTTSEVSLPSMKRTASSDLDVSFMSRTDSTGSVSESGKKSDTPVPDKSRSSRKAPQKWTTKEKKLFFEAVEKHGQNWKLLESAVGTRSVDQIKNFWYDCQKKKSGKKATDPSIEEAEKQSRDKSNTQQISHSEHPDSYDATDHSVSTVPTSNPPLLRGPSPAQTPPPHHRDFETGDVEGEMASRQSGGHAIASHTAADIWAHAQQQSQMLKQQQHAMAEARRRMQQHQHQQHQHQQHQHQQQVMNLSNLMPWLTPTQLAQAAALQQQQQHHHHQQQQQQQQQQQHHHHHQQQQQHHHQHHHHQQQQQHHHQQQQQDWVEAAQIHLLHQAQAGHHQLSMPQASQLRSIAAMANYAAMNPGSLSGNTLGQMENSSGAPAPMHANDAERMEALRQGMLHGFGGNPGVHDSLSSYRGPSGSSSTGSSSSNTSSSAAAALSLLARAGLNRGENNYMEGNQGSGRHNDGNEGY